MCFTEYFLSHRAPFYSVLCPSISYLTGPLAIFSTQIDNILCVRVLMRWKKYIIFQKRIPKFPHCSCCSSPCHITTGTLFSSPENLSRLCAGRRMECSRISQAQVFKYSLVFVWRKLHGPGRSYRWIKSIFRILTFSEAHSMFQFWLIHSLSN